MDVTASKFEDIAVLAVNGDVDGSTAPVMQEHVLKTAQANEKMLLDLSGVTFMSSAGLRVMLLLYRQIGNNKGKVVLVGLSEELRDTMTATGFLKFFLTAETLAEGLEALK